MRQFLAIALSDELRDALTGLQRRLQERISGWRWTRSEGLHVTLRFLGEVQPEIDRPARELWRKAASSVSHFEARVDRIGTFPPRGRPRVLWVGLLEEGAGARRFEALARAFEDTARGLGFPPERRPFRAHITLARAQGRNEPGRPAEDPLGPIEAFSVDSVTLYRSRLSKEGARYTALEVFPLRERARTVEAPSDPGAESRRG